MVFGTNALVTKPAQSLAPMLTVWILNQYGYQQFKAIQDDPSAVDKMDTPLTKDLRDLNSAMFYMTCVIPVVIGLLQVIIWRFFTIRSSHLTMAKYVES